MAGGAPISNAIFKGEENENSTFCEKDDGAGNGAHVFGRFERHAR
jgi:hypothetical protein